MKMTFRWYGNSDPISLQYIKQIPGCSGIIGMMDDFKAGEVWDQEIFSKFSIISKNAFQSSKNSF